MTPTQPYDESPEALRYAAVLRWGVRLAAAFLLVSYLLYLTGLLPPLVPLDVVAANWRRSHTDFAAVTGWPSGWAWAAALPASDMLTLLAIAGLSSLTTLALLAILPLSVRRRDWAFASLVVVEVAILLLAASGLVGGGH